MLSGTEEEKSKGIETILEEGSLFPNAPEIYKTKVEDLTSRDWEKNFFKELAQEYTELSSAGNPVELYKKLFGGSEEASQKAAVLYNTATGAQNTSVLNIFRQDLAQKLAGYTTNNIDSLLEETKQSQDNQEVRGFQRALINYAISIAPKVDTENSNNSYNDARQAVASAQQENKRINENPQQYLEEKLQNAGEAMRGFAGIFANQILQDYLTYNINQAIDKINEKVGGLTQFTKLTIELAKEQAEEGKLNKNQAALQLALLSYQTFNQEPSPEESES